MDVLRSPRTSSIQDVLRVKLYIDTIDTPWIRSLFYKKLDGFGYEQLNEIYKLGPAGAMIVILGELGLLHETVVPAFEKMKRERE